jgi:hypothetical protein
MRRILIEAARRRRAVRYGGGRRRRPLDEALAGLEAGEPDDRLLALDNAPTRFAEVDPAKAELVRLRLFAGLSQDEAAAAQGLSRATAARHWAYARAWLFDAIQGASRAKRDLAIIFKCPRLATDVLQSAICAIFPLSLYPYFTYIPTFLGSPLFLFIWEPPENECQAKSTVFHKSLC